jgi:hypothetical protein
VNSSLITNTSFNTNPDISYIYNLKCPDNPVSRHEGICQKGAATLRKGSTPVLKDRSDGAAGDITSMLFSSLALDVLPARVKGVMPLASDDSGSISLRGIAKLGRVFVSGRRRRVQMKRTTFTKPGSTVRRMLGVLKRNNLCTCQIENKVAQNGRPGGDVLASEGNQPREGDRKNKQAVGNLKNVKVRNQLSTNGANIRDT